MSAISSWRAVAAAHYTPAQATLGVDMDIGTAPRMIRFGHCTLDEGRGVLIAPDGAETSLRPKTFELLRLLLRHPGRVVARGEILDAVWPGIFVTDDSITQCVVELRRAMGPAGNGLLRTMPRRGYLLQAEVMAEALPATGLASAITRAEDRPSIAVLPFRGAVPDGVRLDAEDAYFEDGIIEGIVHVLSGLDRILVVSRGSALAVAEMTRDPREVGARLGVRYVLQGGLRRAGTRLRITTELSEAETGSILRTDRHEGDVSDIFALQDRIAESAVAVIAPQVRAHELARALRKPPNSLTAYDLVLRALDEIRHMSRDGLDRGQALLEQAIAADPDYSLAYSHIGWQYSLRIAQGWSADVAADAAAADHAAAAALERNPQDGFAIALRGVLLGYIQRDLEQARRMLDTAVAISPSCALAWSWGGLVRCWVDQGQDAVAWAERGYRLAPLDPFTFLHEHVLSQAHYVAGDYEAAVCWARASVASNPSHSPSLRVWMATLIAAGRSAEVEEPRRRMLLLEPGFSLRGLAARTPLQAGVRDRFVTHLREAGLPD